jgi:hypothetical protein
MSGKRFFSAASIVMAFAVAGLSVASRQFLSAALRRVLAEAWLIRAVVEWNAPARACVDDNPGRAQLMVGAILFLGVMALFFWGP